MAEHPKVANGVAVSIYFKKGTIKNLSRWIIDQTVETDAHYELKLKEDPSGHTVTLVNGRYTRLQFLSKTVLPKSWPRWSASPATVKGTSVIIPKKTLVTFKPRAKRGSKIKTKEAKALNGAGDLTLKDVFTALDAVNAAKTALGDHCVLSVDPKTGHVKALIER